MTKKEIVDAVSASAGVSKKDTAAVIDSLLAAITDAVVKGDSVQFTGFGTFESRKNLPTQGTIPLPVPRSTSRLLPFRLSRPARHLRML